MELLAENLWMIEEDGVVTLGLTAALQDEAGDVAYANIAPLGNIDIDDTILNIEASKAAIEVASPVVGKVILRNEQAEANPSLLNSTDTSENWIVKIQK